MRYRITPLISAAATAALFTGLVQAAPPEDKVKEPVVHVAFSDTFSSVSNDSAIIIGPVGADESMEILTLTTTNRNQNPITVQYRAIEPLVAPTSEEDCVAPAGVRDEVMRVIVPPFSTVHQTFPDGLEVPGYVSGQWPLEVNEPASSWCLVAFVPNDGLASEGDAYEGRVSLRPSYAE